MNKTAFVMRGVPGSGKSTWLEKELVRLKAIPTDEGYDPWSDVCSADKYHMVDGVYRYDPKNAKAAHERCFKRFINLCSVSQIDIVAVDNTNVRIWELARYVAVAETYGYEVKIIRMVCDPQVAIARNVHGVPAETIWQMHLNMESLAGTPWKETPVFTTYEYKKEGQS